MFDKEKKQREELESEVVVLRSELGKFSFLLWPRMLTVGS
jgi:hypothetical protein